MSSSKVSSTLAAAKKLSLCAGDKIDNQGLVANKIVANVDKP